MTALAHLIDQVKAAAADGRALDIQGGGTKRFYGEPPQGEPLSTRELAGIVSYEPSELVVTVRAGTPLAELEAALAQQGQCLPFEPPRFAGGGTVGGMVAAGLAGPARASVGSVRDYLLGASLLNGRAELLSFGGQVMKNVAGYDVSRVLAGSLGTLGLIVEVSLKVLPVAPAEATLVFACDQAEALRRLNAWGGQPLPLNASCWRLQDGQGQLLLRLRGAAAAVAAACRQLGGERLDAQQAADVWNGCRDQRLSFFAPDRHESELWRLSVPQTAPALALDGATLLEWHGGQRWVRMVPGQAERVRGAARAAGGHATLFRAAPHAAMPAPARFDVLSAPVARIHRALKQSFDPRGIFNPGRLYAGM